MVVPGWVVVVCGTVVVGCVVGGAVVGGVVVTVVSGPVVGGVGTVVGTLVFEGSVVVVTSGNVVGGTVVVVGGGTTFVGGVLGGGFKMLLRHPTALTSTKTKSIHLPEGSWIGSISAVKTGRPS